MIFQMDFNALSIFLYPNESAPRLSPDDGVALLGNTLATWGILFALITVFGPVSGAHFNPVVSTAFFLKKELDLKRLVAFTPSQGTDS